MRVTETRGESRLQLTIVQDCPPTPGQPEKTPFHIPVAIGLVGDGGAELLGAGGAGIVELTTDADVDNPNADGTLVVHVVDRETTLRFDGVPDAASVSFLRGFSAPVKVNFRRPAVELGFLAANDCDGFARWDAAQSLLTWAMREDPCDANLDSMFEHLLSVAARAPDDGEAKALLVAMMTLPREQYLLDLEPGSDILHWFEVRETLGDRLSETFRDRWFSLFEANASSAEYEPDGISIARRQLKNLALSYYARTASDAADLIEAQRTRADNLTDRIVAFALLLGLEAVDDARKQAAVDAFYDTWREEALVVDLWFSTQAGCVLPGALGRVEALEQHHAFDIKNPNKVRSLFSAFAANVRNVHAEDGSGYTFLADRIQRLDAINPQIAARLTTPLTRWQRFDPARQQKIRGELERLGGGDLSKDLREIVSKSLAI